MKSSTKSPIIHHRSLAKQNQPLEPRDRDEIYDGDKATYNRRLLSPREPPEILRDLKRLDFDNKDEILGVWLAREKVFTNPQVLLPLAGNYYVSFGGPVLAVPDVEIGTGNGNGNGTGNAGDGKDIHSYFSVISTPGSRVPQVAVFDIGGVFLKREDGKYQSTDFRLVMDMWSKEVWMFYEYFKCNEDTGAVEKNPFTMNGMFFRSTGKIFDCAKVLNSIADWNEGLRVGSIEKSIKKSCCNIRAYISPAPSAFVDQEIKEMQEEKEMKRKKTYLPNNLRRLFSKSKIQTLIEGLNERLSSELTAGKY